MSTRGVSVRPSRYGEFPQLFWDAEPKAFVDVRNPVILARLLTRGDAPTVGRLVPPDLLREQLESLDVPEHVRTFWRRVLRHATGAAGGEARQQR